MWEKTKGNDNLKCDVLGSHSLPGTMVNIHVCSLPHAVLSWPGPKPQLQALAPLALYVPSRPLTTRSNTGPTLLTPHLPLLVPHLREAPPPLVPGLGP